jgi:hypothetical protein
MLKTEIQETYSVKTTITKSNDKSNMENTIYIVDFESKDQEKNGEAQKSLENLFTAVSTRIFDHQIGNQIMLAVFFKHL